MPIAYDDDDDVAATRTTDIKDTTSNIGAASSFVGAISSLGGAVTQGMAMRAQASYQAKMADINHQLAQYQASDALARGGVAANQQLIKGQEMVGAERAAEGGSGVDVNSGDAARVQNRTTEMSGIDALTIANNATREAFGYKIGAINATAQGQFAQSAGNANATNTEIAGGLSGLAQGLKGFSRLPNSSPQGQDPTKDFNFDTYSMPQMGSDFNAASFSLSDPAPTNYSILGGG